MQHVFEISKLAPYSNSPIYYVRFLRFPRHYGKNKRRRGRALKLQNTPSRGDTPPYKLSPSRASETAKSTIEAHSGKFVEKPSRAAKRHD